MPASRKLPVFIHYWTMYNLQSYLKFWVLHRHSKIKFLLISLSIFYCPVPATPVLVTPPWRKRVINSTSSRSRSPSSMSSLEKSKLFGLIVNQGIFRGIFWIAWLEAPWGQGTDWTKIIHEWFLHLVLSDPFFFNQMNPGIDIDRKMGYINMN